LSQRDSTEPRPASGLVKNIALHTLIRGIPKVRRSPFAIGIIGSCGIA
jgi:hypothetical protein